MPQAAKGTFFLHYKKEVNIVGNNIKTVWYGFSEYAGGLANEPKKRGSIMCFTGEALGIRTSRAFTNNGNEPKKVVIKWSDVASIEISSQQVAKSRLGATLLFGEIGALAASSTKNQTAVIVHTKDGQSAYYVIDKQNPINVKASIAPILQAVGVPFADQVQQPIQSAIPSAADELEKLAALKEQGVLTQEEFDAKKKQLLGL